MLFLPVRAQEDSLSKRIDLFFHKAPLSEILNSISEQAALKFSYSSTNINLAQKITIKRRGIILKDALNELLLQNEIQWKLVGGQITLRRLEKSNIKLCGNIYDRGAKIPLQYAAISIKAENISVLSDYNGSFCLDKLGEGTYTVIIKAFGYKSMEYSFNVNEQSQPLKIELDQQNIELNETIITSDKIIENASVSETQLSSQQIEAAKGISNDPMKAITVLPGVLANVDIYGPSELHVRGGESYENLFLLDNIKLPWAFYFLGQSVINPEMIEKTELLAGGYNANYGNAMSSIFNFSTKTGDFERYNGNVDISFLNSCALIQGPIITNKLSGILGIRRNNIDLYTRFIGIKTNLFDITGKLSLIINGKNKLNFTSLVVNDQLDFTKSQFMNGLTAHDRIDAQSLQLQSIFSNKAYSKFSVLHSGINLVANFMPLSYYINDNTYCLREDLSIYPSTNSKIKTGIEINVEDQRSFVIDTYRATDISITDSVNLTQVQKVNKVNPYAAVYFFYEGKVTKHFTYIAGVRLDYNYLNNNYFASPRFTTSYKITGKTTLSASYGHFNQSPSIYQVTQNYGLVASKCVHYILSFKQQIVEGLLFKTEAYYKDYSNMIVFDTLWKFSNRGGGAAKGLEFSMVKEKGRLNGWLSYSFAKTERQRNLQDKVYPGYYDQRHAANAQVNYTLKRKRRRWFIPHSYSLQFKYASGSPYTPIVGVDSLAGKFQLLTGTINSIRNPQYQNLNAKVQWQKEFGRNEKHSIKFYIDFWNLLSNKNLLERVYTLNKTGTYTVQNKFTTPFLLSMGVKITFNDFPK